MYYIMMMVKETFYKAKPSNNNNKCEINDTF